MSKNKPEVQVTEVETKQPELKDVVNTELTDVVETPAPVKEELKVEVRNTSQLNRVVNQRGVAGQLTPQKDTASQQIIRSIISDYAAGMMPACPVSEIEGARFQLKLWRAVEQVLRSPAELFHVHMNTFLEEMRKHRKTVFNEKYAFRFFHRVELPETSLKSFERLMNLFINTCDPASRAHSLKQIDMEKTLEKITDEEIRQRIFAFYHHK